jgi:hypothetical protein
MATKFIIFVIDGSSALANEAEMLSINVFNDRLRAEGHWLSAGGLATPEQSKLIDHRHGKGFVSSESLFSMASITAAFSLSEPLIPNKPSNSYSKDPRLVTDGMSGDHF